jgi:hypothetical protein
MQRTISIRTDPALRATAVAAIGALAIGGIVFYRIGWGGPNLPMYVAFGLLAVIASGIISWPASVDGAGRLRLVGLNQRFIPLSAIREVRPAGRWVEIRWMDGSRERTRRVFPKDEQIFIAWLEVHVDAARAA